MSLPLVRQAAGAGLVLCLVALAAACSLRSDDAPRPIAREAIPTVLYQQNPASTTTIQSDSNTKQQALYVVRTQGTSEYLVGQRVAIANPPDPRDVPRTVLDRLVSNPPVSEQADLVSFIPPTVKVLGAVSDGDVLDIDLSNLSSIESTHLRLAVAQIVFTATELPEVRGVRFKVDGTPSAVPVGDGASSDVDAIITRFDFPKLRSTANGATTTTAPQAETTETPGEAPSEAPSEAPADAPSDATTAGPPESTAAVAAP